MLDLGSLFLSPIASTVEGGITWHLEKIFNSRQDIISYLPSYGLPSLDGIYQQDKAAINYFIQQVKEIILQYEPRIISISNQSLTVSAPNIILQLQIVMAKESCSLVGYFSKEQKVWWQYAK